MPTSYQSNATLRQIASRLRSTKAVALVTHEKPDADAAGSTLALARGLTHLGKRADVYWMGPIEPNLLRLAEPTPVRLVEQSPPPDSGHDLVVVVDTGAWSQLEPIAAWLKAQPQRVVGLDHHAHGDDVASMRFIDPGVASTTVLAAIVLEAMGVRLAPGAAAVTAIAEALFAGLATDTGWFRFANTNAEAFALAGRLMQCGVNHPALFQLLEENHRPARLALEARALASLEYVRDGAAAIMSLAPDDFRATGGRIEDLSQVVNLPMQVGAVRLAVLLTQTEPGLTKISLRSKPRVDGSDSTLLVDVNALGRRLGGGGHVHAAGARLKLDLPQARAAVIAAIEQLQADDVNR